VNYLIYINELGPNYRGENIYEFIFSDVLDVWGENWDSKPANGYPEPPELENVKKVGVLTTSEMKLSLIQNSDIFSVLDSMQGVICLGWENDEEQDFDNKKRLVFSFGESEKLIKDKLYERDIVLEFEKKVVYEN
jgi:hypothetical protein